MVLETEAEVVSVLTYQLRYVSHPWYCVSESARIAGFTRHEETPLMSTKQYNLATDSGDIDGTGSNPPQVPVCCYL